MKYKCDECARKCELSIKVDVPILFCPGDGVRQNWQPVPSKWGCCVDAIYNTCELDPGRDRDCILIKDGMNKREDCPYWMVIDG